MARLIESRPARTIGMNRRSLTGRVALQEGGSVAFESSLERDFLVILDFDPMVSAVLSQPLTVEYIDMQGGQRRYTPDVLVEYDGFKPILYEVKYRADLQQNWSAYRTRFKAAIHYCRIRDWRFRIITENEIRASGLLANAKFLRPYREFNRNESIEEHLVRTLAILGETTPAALLRAAYTTQEWRMRAMNSLWCLVANGRIHTDLLRALTMNSPIWVTIGEGFLCPHPLSLQLRQAP